MVRTVVLPGCIDGVITGCILSVGRILGESAALLFTAGFAHALHGIFDGLSSPGATLTVALYVYAKEEGEFDVADGDTDRALVGQVLRRDLILGGRVGHILWNIAGGREQVWAVAQGGHIHGVHGKRFLIHHVDRQMGEVEVFQLHGADIIIVIDPVALRMGVALLVRPGIRLNVVPPLHLHRLGEDIS